MTKVYTNNKIQNLFGFWIFCYVEGGYDFLRFARGRTAADLAGISRAPGDVLADVIFIPMQPPVIL